MAKYWEKGRVKTRLAESLAALADVADGGDVSSSETNENVSDFSQLKLPEQASEIAARIYRGFLAGLLEGLQSMGDVRELVGSPAERLDDFANIFDERFSSQAWSITDQGDGDLGDRMRRWFARNLTDPSEPSRRRECVLIGADCPLLSGREIEAAWAALRDHDLVLGPALDGGYYLIGLRAGGDLGDERLRTPLDSLFSGIQWSTSRVLQDTIAAADRIGWKTRLLETRRDVDDAEDLRVLLQTLRDTGQNEHPILKTLGGMKFREIR